MNRPIKVYEQVLFGGAFDRLITSVDTLEEALAVIESRFIPGRCKIYMISRRSLVVTCHRRRAPTPWMIHALVIVAYPHYTTTQAVTTEIRIITTRVTP